MRSFFYLFNACEIHSFSYLLFRAICGGLYTAFYWSKGDACAYFHASELIRQAFLSDFIYGCKILFYPIYLYLIPDPEVNLFTEIYDWYLPIELLRHPFNTWPVAVFTLPLNVLSGGNYLYTGCLTGLIAGGAALYQYRYACKVFPHARFWWKMTILFWPGTLWWASGIGKEMILFMLISLLTVQLHKWRTGKAGFGKIILIFAGIAVIRSYLAVGLAGALVAALVVEYFFFSEKKTFKKRLSGTVAVLLLPVVLYGLLSFTRLNPVYIWAEMIYNRTSTAGEVPYRQVPETAFILTTDTTLTGMIRTVPSALTAAYFRPYLFELVHLKGAGHKAAAADAFWTLVLVSVGLYFRMKHHPRLTVADFGIIGFAVLYGIFCGLSVGNWGVLIRYKVYYVPLLLWGAGLKTLQRKEGGKSNLAFRK